ncbi:MAG: hypothetical protein AAFO81_07240 [Pseudomonadota bacterium]
MRVVVITMLLVCVMLPVAVAGDPFGDDWPAGPNRELTGAFCGACHSLSLVQQQAMDRQRWDSLLTWMSEKQNMPVVDDALRALMLDYLVANFGPDAAPDSTRLTRTLGGLQGVALQPLLMRD